MTDQLDNALKRLVKESRADAALVWSRVGRTGGAILLGSYPVTIPAGPLPCSVPEGAGTGAVERDRSRMTDLLPDMLLRELPAHPAAARSFTLAEDLELTVVWSDPSASPDLIDERQRQALDEVGPVAQLVRRIHFADGELARMRAVVNGLQDGVATLDPGLGLVAVNQAAANLLGMPLGLSPAPAFDDALSRLVQRALNQDEITSCAEVLNSNPMATVECTWRFEGRPSHLYVVSRPVEYHGFRGRTWVFYDESVSAQAMESLGRAHAQLRASADGMLDPQALLEAVRDDRGQIVDFWFRDVNRATCEYLSKTRDELIGHTALESMPNIGRSGLLAWYAQCVETHEPVILDDYPYANEILPGPRHYDIRGNHVGGDFLTLTWRDVTDRFESSRRIAESEERFRLLAENSSDVVSHVRDGVIAWVSPSVDGVLGAPPEYWIGKDLRDVVPPDELANQADIVARVYAGESVKARSRVVAKDGTTRWIHMHAKLFYDAHGIADGFTASFRPIDDEIRMEAEAEEARRRQAAADALYRRLMDNSAVPMCLTSPEGRFEVVNDAICRYFGHDAEVLCTKTWQELCAPEYLEIAVADFADIIAGRTETHRGVKQYIRSDGQRIWGDLSASCLRTADGQPESVIAQIIDITDQVRIREIAEEARRQQDKADARYRRLMDSSAVGMSLVTPSGRFEIVNQALCDFFGYDAETLKTMSWQELTAADSLDDDLSRADDVIAGRIDRYRLTKQYIHADGHAIWGDLSVSSLRGPDGEVEYFVSQIIDITAEVGIRRQVAQRDQQNRALARRLQEQTDRLRSELKIARAYVTSLLPEDLDGPVQVTQRYLPSRELGGDCFDFRWIDDHHLLTYLIDVSGHGIAPALEAISVHNLLRSGSLTTATLLEPERVLAELNSKFPMDQHGGNYFTMWYGVYDSRTRTLTYASAGHPPAIALTDPGVPPATLTAPGLPVGMFADTTFGPESYVVPPGAQIVLYSDGAFELPLPAGTTWSLPDFIDLCTTLHASGDWTVEELAEKLKARTVAGLFNDDCSLLRLQFT